MRSKMTVRRGHPFYYLARRQRNFQNLRSSVFPQIDKALTLLRRMLGLKCITESMFIVVQTHVTT